MAAVTVDSTPPRPERANACHEADLMKMICRASLTRTHACDEPTLLHRITQKKENTKQRRCPLTRCDAMPTHILENHLH